jgi:hypothetical protein
MAARISGALMAEKRARYTCWPATLTIHFSVLSITCSPPYAQKSHCSTTSSRVILYHCHHYVDITTRCSCQKRQGVSAHKLKVKDANIPPLVGLARCKHDPNQPLARCLVFIMPPASRVCIGMPQQGWRACAANFLDLHVRGVFGRRCVSSVAHLEANVLSLSVAIQPEHEVGAAPGLLLQVLAHMRLLPRSIPSHVVVHPSLLVPTAHACKVRRCDVRTCMGACMHIRMRDLLSTLGVASVLIIGASKREAGSVVSQFWYLGGKSTDRTWPMTEVILKWAARPWNLPSHSCTSK